MHIPDKYCNDNICLERIACDTQCLCYPTPDNMGQKQGQLSTDIK